MKTVDFSESIAACDLKVGRCRQLFETMKVCEYLRSRLFVYHIFFRFCVFCAMISGERLQDHWSSGYYVLTRRDSHYMYLSASHLMHTRKKFSSTYVVVPLELTRLDSHYPSLI